MSSHIGAAAPIAPSLRDLACGDANPERLRPTD
jgi:hypothetical protein